MKKLVAFAAVVASLSSAASAQSYDMESCFEEAGIKFVADTAGTDMATARQLAQIMPDGKEMLASLRQSAAVASEARASGLDKNTMIILARGSLADTPALSNFVSSCINSHF